MSVSVERRKHDFYVTRRTRQQARVVPCTSHTVFLQILSALSGRKWREGHSLLSGGPFSSIIGVLGFREMSVYTQALRT